MSFFIKLTLVVILAIMVRWCISLNRYSGADTPPMFGDYEAQRHWMEICYNLKPQDWYENTTDNDLLYWGLDYPPLTAYHSWVCGAVANWINPDWVALNSSHGYESYTHKLFMRYSVVIADVLLFFSAVVYYFLSNKQLTEHKQVMAVGVCLFYPGIILIDHGHFQYNCVSLGLALWSVALLSSGHDLLGSVTFTLALNYKQMELYHSIPFFCYLLGSCIRSGPLKGIWKLLQLGTVVLGAFALCWYPFINSKDSAMQVIHRLFPFSRGLYEDKVANIWCSLSVFVKLKEILSTDRIVQLCLVSTLVALIPSSLHLLWKPSLKTFRYALVNSSLIFFLLSFQVHEKSVLLAALPVSLLIPENPLLCIWFLLVSTFSMFPLLMKDQLVIPYFPLCIMFLILGYHVISAFETSNKTAANQRSSQVKKLFIIAVVCASILGCLGLSIVSLVLRPPSHLPDLFSVMIAVFSCAHFVFFTICFHILQFSCSENSQTNVKTVSPKQQYRKKKQL